MLVFKTTQQSDPVLAVEPIPETKPVNLDLVSNVTAKNASEILYVTEKEKLLEIEPYIYQNQIRHVFMDTETTGLDPLMDDIVLIQIYAKDKTFVINTVPIGIDEDVSFFYAGIKKIIEDENILKVFHNAKFDLSFLKQQLFPGIRVKNIFDTYLAEKTLTAGISSKGDNSLQSVAEKHTDTKLDKSMQTTFNKTLNLSPDQIRYAAEDVLTLEPVFKKQGELLSRAGLIDTALLEFSIIPAVIDIELAGMKIDLDKCQALGKQLQKKRNQIEEDLRAIIRDIKTDKQVGLFNDGPTINFNSPVQVKEIFNTLGHPVESTGIEIISKIDHPFARALVEHRKTSKLISSFIEKLPKHVNHMTKRIHPDFLQLGTDTGRFACRNPNMQQIPKEQEWRDLFIAPEGYVIITADYSQIELRILAEISQDESFLESYRTGQDLHKRTAADMFGIPSDQVTKEQRDIAKTINFGLCYGMSAFGLSSRLNISTNQAEKFISTYFKTYPKVKDTLQQLGMKAVKKGYSETLSGRKRYYKKTDSFSSQKSLERKGRNMPIQGTCGDILKKAISYLSEDLRKHDARIINQVHDEIVIECNKEDVEQVKGIIEKDMVKAGKCFLKSVPVEVDIIIDNVWRK